MGRLILVLLVAVATIKSYSQVIKVSPGEEVSPQSGSKNSAMVPLGSPYITRAVPIPQGALPVKITKFNIERPRVKSILMLWETASEINSSHFEVLRSTDNVTWVSVGRVASHGNSAVTQHYEFEDDISGLLINGVKIVYYRLKEVDINQKEFDYSIVLSANLDDLRIEGISVYPNPTSDFIRIQGVDIHQSMKITDITGKMVQFIPEGTTVVDVSELSKGVYFLECGSETRRFVVR